MTIFYAYGNKVGSTWRAYVKYDITETPTYYDISFLEAGIDIYGTTYFYDGPVSDSGGLTSALAYNGVVIATKKNTSEGFTKTSALLKGSSANVPIKKYSFTKGRTAQSASAVYDLASTKWYRGKGSTATEQAAAGSSVSLDFTIPAIAPPKVELYAERDPYDKYTIKVTAKIKSFVGDVITNITLKDGSGRVLGSQNAQQTIPSSEYIIQTFTLTGAAVDSYDLKVVATGIGGTSETAYGTVPVAFYTMNVGLAGKEVAFGCYANDSGVDSTRGLFRVAMDTKFDQDINTDRNVNATGFYANNAKISPMKVQVLEKADVSIDSESYTGIRIEPSDYDAGWKAIGVLGIETHKQKVHPYTWYCDDAGIHVSLRNNHTAAYTIPITVHALMIKV